jgi:hypothetical protein
MSHCRHAELVSASMPQFKSPILDFRPCSKFDAWTLKQGQGAELGESA